MADNDGFEPTNNNEQPNDQGLNDGAEQTPQVGNVITPGQQPAEPESPAAPVQSATAPEVAAASNTNAAPQAPGVNASPAAVPLMPSGNQKPKKKWLLPALVVAGVVVAGGAFFGIKQYTNSPGYVWNKAFSNTASGYEKLSSSLDKYTNTEYKSANIEGSLAIDGGSAAQISGDIKGSVGEKNADISMDFEISGETDGNSATLKAGLDVRVLEGEGEYPDLYMRARELDGVAKFMTQFGATPSQANSLVAPYNDQWFTVTGKEISQLAGASLATGAASSAEVKPEQVTELLRNLNNPVKEYLLGSGDTAVIERKEFIGKEDKNGRNAYHYKAIANKDNGKKFADELKKVFENSELGKQIIKESGMSADDIFDIDEMTESTEGEEYKEEFDIWVDAETRMISAIRLTSEDNDKTHTELVLGYDGGDDVSLAIVGRDEDTDTDMKIELGINLKSNVFSFDVDVEQGGDIPGGLVLSLKVTPKSDDVKIDRPSGAKTVQELMQLIRSTSTQLGMGGATIGGSGLTDAELRELEGLYSDSTYFDSSLYMN